MRHPHRHTDDIDRTGRLRRWWAKQDPDLIAVYLSLITSSAGLFVGLYLVWEEEFVTVRSGAVMLGCTLAAQVVFVVGWATATLVARVVARRI